MGGFYAPSYKLYWKVWHFVDKKKFQYKMLRTFIPLVLKANTWDAVFSEDLFVAHLKLVAERLEKENICVGDRTAAKQMRLVFKMLELEDGFEKATKTLESKYGKYEYLSYREHGEPFYNSWKRDLSEEEYQKANEELWRIWNNQSELQHKYRKKAYYIIAENIDQWGN